MEDFELLQEALRRYGKEFRAIRYDRGGGHKLFWKVGYYWKNLRTFLHEELCRTSAD